jgi:DNA polymerase-1
MSTTRTVEDTDIHYVGEEDDPAEFLSWISRPHAAVGFDVETGGPDPLNPFVPGFEVRLVAFATSRTAWVLHPGHREAIVEGLLAEQVFVAHNAAFDTLAVRRYFGVVPVDVVDTLLLALMVFPPASEDDEEDEGLAADDRHKLKPLSLQTGSSALHDADEELHRWFAELELRPRGGDQSDAVRAWEGRCYATAPVQDPRYWVYNGLDAAFCLRVLRWLLARWEGEDGDIRALTVNESRLGSMLTGVTWRGLRVDRPALGALFRAAVDAQHDLLPAFAELGAANPASAQQVSAALLELGVEKPVMSEAGLVSTDKVKGLPRLLEADQPDEVRRLAELLVAFRDHGKLRSKTREISALVQATGDGRVHPQLNALKARTGRMSIARPALQNLPKADQRIRAAFLAEDGYVLVGADFSQVEYRVAAALSGDENMIEVIRDGRDLHDHTATQIFGPEFTKADRQAAKTVGFAVQYGSGARRIAGTIGKSEREAQKIIDGFFEAYPELGKFMAKVSREPLILSKSGRRTAIDPNRTYANTNYHIQGAARDLFADALLRLRAAGWGDALWLVIHDEIILQVPEEQAEAACAALENAMNTTFMGVPITAEAEVIGKRWGRLPEVDTSEDTEPERAEERAAA